MVNIYNRVRAAQAKAERASKAKEYKTGEHARRSNAARVAALVRRDNRDDAIIDGTVEPRNARELAIQRRAEFGDTE